MDNSGVGQGQGGGGVDQVMDQVSHYLELALNPIKLVQQIIGMASQGSGDSVGACELPAQTATITSAEVWASASPSGYALDKRSASRAQVARALEEVEKNWDTLAGKDGVVTLDDLTRIDQGDYPQTLKDAARLIAQNGRLFAKLDGANGSGVCDGQITLGEARKVLADYQKLLAADGPAQGPGQSAGAAQTGGPPVQGLPDAAQRGDDQVQRGGEQGPKLSDDDHPVSPTPDQTGQGTGGTEQSQSSLTSVLDDPNTSFEGKTMVVLDNMMTSAAEDAESVYQEFIAANQRSNDQKLTADERKAASALANNLNFTLQRAMQKRQEMFTLLSNMTTMFHDMAMTAIHNMKG